jgi:putative membrane-bound dehydrogenase-like protein
MRRLVVLAGLAVSAATSPAADPFPKVYDSEPAANGRPLGPAEAAAAFTLPPGFSVSLLAAEPDVRNPIALAWDRRGRLWVAENYTYAEGSTRFDLALRDRVLIFEDTDHDGRFDRRTVFTDNVQMLTGIEVGQGGVWLMCPPGLLFLPDRDHDDVPDGPAETILDGFEVTGGSYHNFANGLKFGPDGWLYGRCGHSCPARIGRPGTPADRRLPMEGGLWRYCVRTGAIEVLTTGTTNPWGHDWTAEGECFFVNTVNGHLWHVIPGAHFRQQNGIDPNPSTYELIDQHADHYHFDTGAGWQASRHGKADALGGGHAHSGCMIYQGLNWPAEYRGRLFTLNFHGRRMNQERLARSGSGYVATHEPDLFPTRDTWFRGIDLASGPDGGVVLLDWSDTGECHERDGVHRQSGRIYKLVHGRPEPPPFRDLDALDDLALARNQRHADGWCVIHSRLALAERAATRPIDPAAVALLKDQLDSAAAIAAAEPALPAAAVRVRGLLTLHLVGGIDHDGLVGLTAHADEHVRTWAVRLLTETWPLDAALGPVPQEPATADRVRTAAAALAGTLADLARREKSGLVRLAIGSTLQRLPIGQRAALAAALVARTEDADDHNLPLLVWYGLIPVADAAPGDLSAVLAACTWPTTRRLIARRLAERLPETASAVDVMLRQAATAADDGVALDDVLQGMTTSLAGWRSAARPAAWPVVEQAVARLPAGDRRDRCTRLAAELGVLFGDGRALDAVRGIALDETQPVAVRGRALETLIDARPPDLRQTCERLLAVRHLQLTAARGLATFDDPAVARQLVNACRRSSGDARSAVVSILASRPTFARELLAAVDAKSIPAAALTPFHVRQIRSLGDPQFDARLAALWGSFRDTPADRKDRIARLTVELNAAAPADLGRGRLLYRKHCGCCHRLYGEGGGIGPDLTGSGRHDLGYLLENMVDPNAVVNRDWRMSIAELADGRVLSGVVVEDRDRTLTLLSPTDRVIVAKDEIEQLTPTDRSLMPEGLLDQLPAADIRDLVGYLRHPIQVPLPDATAAGDER